MGMVLLIIALSLATACIIFTIFVMVIRRVAGRRVREARVSLKDEGIIAITKRANFLGRQSASVALIRGNGLLVLTSRQLAFYMYAPKREHHIALDKIEGIEHPRFFRGRSVGLELLVVRFRGDAGVEDAIAYWVPKPRRWATMIRRGMQEGPRSAGTGDTLWHG